MVKQRDLFWLLPVLALLTYPLWRPLAVGFLSPRSASDPAGETRPAGKTFVMDDIVFSQSKNGVKEWQVKARQLYTDVSEENLKMDEVEAVFTGRSGGPDKEPVHISGGQGHYNAAKQVLTLTDDVVVTTGGYEMRTNRLQYLGNVEQFKVTDKVRITGKNFEADGTSLIYDLQSGDYQVGGRVYVTAW